MLEMLPGSLDGIQVRRVRRQTLDTHAATRGAGQKLLDRDTPVDRRPIPDHQQARANVSDQVLEKLDDVEAVEGLLTHQDVELAGRRHAAHYREVVARLPLMEDRRVAFGGVRPNLARKKIEAGFVHENKGAALTVRLGLDPGPDLDPPAFDLLFVALDRASDRHLWRPA